ncbi:MAG: hypothetical protein HQL69_17420 [Magnetococcales bacterium]|nr:hypothetical protein [Magnetococcales bacterium]
MKFKQFLFTFGSRGLAFESSTIKGIQPNLKPLLELIIRQEGHPERRVRPGKSKQIIIFGNGLHPNLPKSEFIEINDPSVNPTHCLLRYDGRFGWRVENIKWNGANLAPKNESWEAKPRRVDNGSLISVGKATVLPIFE